MNISGCISTTAVCDCGVLESNKILLDHFFTKNVQQLSFKTSLILIAKSLCVCVCVLFKDLIFFLNI